jgi:hypothetical protein
MKCWSLAGKDPEGDGGGVEYERYALREAE